MQKKVQQERVARESAKDQTRYDVTIEGVQQGPLSKRQTLFAVVRHLCNKSVTPDALTQAQGRWRTHDSLWKSVEGEVDATKFAELIQLQQGGKFQPQVRLFCDDGELIHANGRTYAFTKMLGAEDLVILDRWKQAFQSRPELAFSVSQHAE